MNKGGSLRDLSRSLPPFRLQFPIYGLLLSADEVRVNSRLCNQLLMPAFLHDASVIDNENLIGMTHGLESVRNHDDRLIARQRLDRLLQPILIFGIDVASSNMTIGAFFSIARAMEIRCFSPPERLAPPSPITVL